MANKKAYLEHLRNVSLFSSCSTKDLEKIHRAGDEVTVKAGHVLVDQGQTGREAFILLSGSATVKRNGKKVATLEPGRYFGELSLLTRYPRNATVTADSEMELLVLGQREFSGLLDEVPGMAHKVLSSMAERLYEADAKSTTN